MGTGCDPSRSCQSTGSRAGKGGEGRLRKFRSAAGKEPFHERAVGVDNVGSVTDGEIQSLPMREK